MSNEPEKRFKVTKTWVVALFPETNQYSVIPTKWILNPQSSTKTIFCQWPPLKDVTSDDLIRADTPDSSWQTFRIKIFGGNKTFDSFNKAWHQQVTCIEESSSTEPECLSFTKNKVVKTNNIFESMSSDENEDNDTGFNIHELPPKNQQVIVNSTLNNHNIPVESPAEKHFTELTPVRVSSLAHSNISLSNQSSEILSIRVFMFKYLKMLEF